MKHFLYSKEWLIERLQYLESREPTVKVQSPKDIYTVMLPIVNPDFEQFYVIHLDGGHQVKEVVRVSEGTLKSTLVHPRKVFRAAIQQNVYSIILVHNHPSGILTPSPEDLKLTEKMVKSGEIIGITVLDHVIVSQTGYYSLKEKGDM